MAPRASGGPNDPEEASNLARADPIAGELVTETFAYEGGRQVTVYVPTDPPPATVNSSRSGAGTSRPQTYRRR